MLDDPDMRAVFERVLGEAQAFPSPADRPYKSGTCLSRLSTIEEEMARLFRAMLEKDEPNLAEAAGRVASLHADAKVDNAMLLKAGFALEDALKDKVPDIPPKFFKRLRSFMVSVVEFCDQRRVQNEEELAESKERYYRAIFETSRSGMAVFDPEGRVWDANKAITEMFGYTKEEILDPDFSWANIIAPEDLPMTMERLKDLMETGRPQSFQLTFVHKSGKKIPTSTSYDRLIKKPEWATDRMVANILDTTELKAQQQTIKELSTPVIPVWSRVLLSPLLGNFDSQRMHDLSERLLSGVASAKPRQAILDLSGLAHVDSQVISEIVRLINAVKLLGTRTLLSGIGPSVAQSLVRIGANLEGIPTYSSLDQALRSIIGEERHG
jgi:PAS domain S-box-containing protein